MNPKELSKREQSLAEQFGGSEDPLNYLVLQGLQYCDKGSHREMSLFHAPQHAEHWKKEDKKRSLFDQDE